MFVYCSKSAHAIGQNRSRAFWLPGNNEWFVCIIDKYRILKSALCIECQLKFEKVIKLTEINQKVAVHKIILKVPKVKTKWSIKIFRTRLKKQTKT